MCIAIALKPFISIDEDTIKICNEANPDGMGFAFFNEVSELVIIKESDKSKIPGMIKKFLAIRKKYIYRPMLLHFRIATHGAVSNRCCHPFKVSSDIAFCHNGILTNEFGATKDGLYSDTMLFNKNILQQIKNDDLLEMIAGEYPILKKLLQDYIGRNNKMIFLDRNDNIQILNESVGVWDKGIWYSNTSYKKRTSYWGWSGGKNTWYDHGGYGGYSGYGGYWGWSFDEEETTPKTTPKIIGISTTKKSSKKDDEHNDELLFASKRSSKDNK